MTVSVIVTCYNLERFIAQAIESVLAQDFPAPFEIIVVDDCSADGSAEVICSYPGVRYLRTKENCGVLLATLEGISVSSGELIFFLDGDDVWKAGKLSASVRAFHDDPKCVLVTHDLDFIDAGGTLLHRSSRPGEEFARLGPTASGPKVIKGILMHDDYVWLGSAYAVRRSIADLDGFSAWARGLPDPANTYQDWPLAYWVASLPGVTAAYVPEKLFSYRLHGANHSGDAKTAARAVRNFTRARNTVAAMHALAVERGLPDKVRRAIEARVRANDYLISLYRGRRGEAMAAFLGIAHSFRRQGELAKELVRLAGLVLLGPERFTRWAARWSASSHDLRPIGEVDH